MPVREYDRLYSAKQIKEIVMELRGLGCPIWKIAKLLNIPEVKVVELSGIERRD